MPFALVSVKRETCSPSTSPHGSLLISVPATGLAPGAGVASCAAPVSAIGTATSSATMTSETSAARARQSGKSGWDRLIGSSVMSDARDQEVGVLRRAAHGAHPPESRLLGVGGEVVFGHHRHAGVKQRALWDIPFCQDPVRLADR